MGAIIYGCPIRFAPSYVIPAIEIRLLGSFHPDSFKTERLETGKADADKNIYYLFQNFKKYKKLYSQ